MADESDKELKLRVAKAIPSDVGHGRARVPFDNELNLMKEQVNPEFIMFVDDTFLTRPKRNFFDWCEMYNKHQIPFWVNTRIESISEDKLKAIKEAGCTRLSFSIEHGNFEFRKKYLKKPFRNEEVIEKGHILAESGIPFSMDELIGIPFETRDLVFDTIELVDITRRQNNSMHPRQKKFINGINSILWTKETVILFLVNTYWLYVTFDNYYRIYEEV